MNLDFSEPKLAKWKENVESAGCIINSVTPLSVQKKGNGELLFAYVSADVTAPEGYKLLPILFVRGDAVIVVPEIVNEETGEQYFLAIEQRRIASGKLHLEFPAGMVDREIDNPAAVAIKELFEETGLPLDESKLISLHPKPLYSSPGASEEKIWFFGTSVKVTQDEFEDLQGRVTGAEEENEYIVTRLVSKGDFIERNVSAQALLAVSLFDQNFM